MIAGAAAGAIAVGLFVAGSLLVGERPGFDAPGAEVAGHLDRERTRILVACVCFAALGPCLVWFLSTISSLARVGGPGARRASRVAYGCGLIFVALFLADVTSLAVSALRPENMAAEPELAVALRDFELLAMGMAAPVVSTLLASLAVLVLRDQAIWPDWVGWLAAIAALAYGLRTGTLVTTEGPFAADGILGLYVPVAAAGGWLVIGSILLTLSVRRVSEPGELFGPRSGLLRREST